MRGTMEELAEQFAAINLSDLCADTDEAAKASELEILSCDELKALEAGLTYRQLKAAEKEVALSEEDRITLQALSIVLLRKYVTNELPWYNSGDSLQKAA